MPCCTGAVNRWHKAFAICNPSGRRSRRCRRTAGGTGYPRGGAGCGGDGVSTGSAWRYRPRRIRRTLCNVANGVNDPLLPCPTWPVAGTDSGDYLALLDWRYHPGTVLLVWSGVVGTLDNVIRPMLIRMGADLPLILILSGVIGGLIAFGMIGLFIGPVLLAVSGVCLPRGWKKSRRRRTNRKKFSKNLAKSRNRISNFSSGGSAA